GAQSSRFSIDPLARTISEPFICAFIGRKEPDLMRREPTMPDLTVVGRATAGRANRPWRGIFIIVSISALSTTATVREFVVRSLHLSERIRANSRSLLRYQVENRGRMWKCRC